MIFILSWLYGEKAVKLSLYLFETTTTKKKKKWGWGGVFQHDKRLLSASLQFVSGCIVFMKKIISSTSDISKDGLLNGLGLQVLPVQSV